MDGARHLRFSESLYNAARTGQATQLRRYSCKWKLLQLIKFQGLVLPYILKCRSQSEAWEKFWTCIRTSPGDQVVCSEICSCSSRLSKEWGRAVHTRHFTFSARNVYFVSPRTEKTALTKEQVLAHTSWLGLIPIHKVPIQLNTDFISIQFHIDEVRDISVTGPASLCSSSSSRRLPVDFRGSCHC